VLSTLLPWLEAKHAQRPDVVVGTSVGALNAAYIVAHPDEGMAKLAEQARQTWETISYRDVLEPLLSVGELTTFGRLAISLTFRGIVPYSLLDPAPLATTLSRLIKCGDVHNNIAHKELRTCAVVATAAHTNRSVVFHDGGANPPSDERRGIDYVPTEISEDHVRFGCDPDCVSGRPRSRAEGREGFRTSMVAPA
jgi:NTE family protein